jgi:UDP:flavonoid glycosyltransferase YjiC (YdhE family)
MPHLPDDLITVDFWPQIELLQRAGLTITHAGLTITHAGLKSVLESLS